MWPKMLSALNRAFRLCPAYMNERLIGESDLWACDVAGDMGEKEGSIDEETMDT